MDPLEKAVERAARVRSVASAIEGERERCAKIAESFSEQTEIGRSVLRKGRSEDHRISWAEHKLAERIAAAIRLAE